VWINARFKDSQLRFIRPGLRAECYITASGRTYEGHVDSIAAIIGGHGVQVRIVLENGENRDLQLRPGMKVVSRIYP
jgi:membrane fusion protein (multidrug efflux system)